MNVKEKISLLLTELNKGVYMFRCMPVFERLMAIGGGLCLIYSGLISDIIGFSLIAAMVGLQFITRNPGLLIW